MPETINHPRKFSRYGVVLVPDMDACVQDLGPFLTGRRMETDILPASALVSFESSPGVPLEEEGEVFFAFEGNAYDAVNLYRFHERLSLAAGRLISRAPSIAYGTAKSENLRPVARFDLVLRSFVDLTDIPAFEAWAEEPIHDILPVIDFPTPCSDPELLKPVVQLPMRLVSKAGDGPFVWSLLDGSLLFKASRDPSDLVELWRPSDEGAFDMLLKSGIEHALARLHVDRWDAA